MMETQSQVQRISNSNKLILSSNVQHFNRWTARLEYVGHEVAEFCVLRLHSDRSTFFQYLRHFHSWVERRVRLWWIYETKWDQNQRKGLTKWSMMGNSQIDWSFEPFIFNLKTQLVYGCFIVRQIRSNVGEEALPCQEWNVIPRIVPIVHSIRTTIVEFMTVIDQLDHLSARKTISNESQRTKQPEIETYEFFIIIGDFNHLGSIESIVGVLHKNQI